MSDNEDAFLNWEREYDIVVVVWIVLWKEVCQEIRILRSDVVALVSLQLNR